MEVEGRSKIFTAEQSGISQMYGRTSWCTDEDDEDEMEAAAPAEDIVSPVGDEEKDAAAIFGVAVNFELPPDDNE